MVMGMAFWIFLSKWFFMLDYSFSLSIDELKVSKWIFMFYSLCKLDSLLLGRTVRNEYGDADS